MRKWLPRKKTVGIWVGAALIAALAIPSAQFSAPITTHSKHNGSQEEGYPHTGAIPTVSQIAMERPVSDETNPLGGTAAVRATESTQVDSAQSSSSNGSKPVPGAKPTPGAKPVPGKSGNPASKSTPRPGNQPKVKPAPGTNSGPNVKKAPGTSGSSGASPGASGNKSGLNRPPAKPGPSAGTPGQNGSQGPSAGTPGQNGSPGPTQGASPAPGAPGTPGTPDPVKPVTPPVVPGTPGIAAPGQTAPPNPFTNLPTAPVRIKVIDGRTLQPLPGAEVVIIETEQRVVTGNDGYTPYIDAPLIRNPKYRPMIQELHGQLGCIAYKNGYRDSIHLGIRVHEDGSKSESTVWMYKLGPGDTRVEPVLYQVPYHHLWLVELADKFRSKTQPGEGPERP